MDEPPVRGQDIASDLIGLLITDRRFRHLGLLARLKGGCFRLVISSADVFTDRWRTLQGNRSGKTGERVFAPLRAERAAQLRLCDSH